LDGSNIDGIELIVPEGFKGILPPSPHPDYFDFEFPTFMALKLLISPGNIIFDIGSSHGVITCLASKLTGETGRVYSFEANPYVIENSKHLASANKLNNIIFINNFIGENSDTITDFFAVPEPYSVASTKNPEIFKFHSDAVPTKVKMLSIDDFVKRSGVIPDVCKIDVEGAEYVVAKGMQRLLSVHSIDLVVETHADEMLKIGGDLNQLLDFLQKIGYSMLDLDTLSVTNKDEYFQKYKSVIGYVLLSKKLNEPQFVKDIITKSTNETISSSHVLSSRLNKLQHSIESEKNYEAATMQLEELIMKLPNHQLVNYLYALCLHMQKKDPQKAIHHYNVALQNGFDEFWVRYNRASILADLGMLDDASADIDRALKLRPNDTGAMNILERIRSLRLTTV